MPQEMKDGNLISDGYVPYMRTDGWTITYFSIDSVQQKAIEHYNNLYDDFEPQIDFGDHYVELEFEFFDVRVYDKHTHQGIQVKFSYHWNSAYDMQCAIEQYNDLLEAVKEG